MIDIRSCTWPWRSDITSAWMNLMLLLMVIHIFGAFSLRTKVQSTTEDSLFVAILSRILISVFFVLFDPGWQIMQNISMDCGLVFLASRLILQRFPST